ncbi:NAD(P)H-binding protein [Myceligenerans pegani]|uniref:NAD(P)H-binding protein n=1 Tax=Myceligenerans pegani TaxID=2776917 RepID=A0ABR9N2K4_9MICO|nr:NAD(P)H-binding protein [Myceligenerans sp. TRM 65318]MBE1877876.1 NAD(P)H-binding protein [Myceligenerans sp. TRM 65318]MBE3020147.1 NAD(P)H-binding protein [Myceligenerans sp. TRM 65318]
MAAGAVVLAGAAGTVGAQLAFRLAAEATEQRVVVPGEARAPRLPDGSPLPDAEVVVLGHASTHGEMTAALDGADTLVIAGTHAADPDPVDLLAAHRFRRVVHLSQIGAHAHATATPARRHWRVEEAVRASGATWTVLRASVQFRTLVHAVRDDVLRAPAGTGRVAAVSPADIADATTAVLLDERAHAHDGVTYRITGPEALTGTDVARTLTRATGRPVRYEPMSTRDAYATPVPWVHDLDAWISCCAAVDAGVFEEVDHAVARLAGRPARTFEDWIDDYPSELAALRPRGTAR